jgi:hypothetical protein
MKKVVATIVIVATAASCFAQGTVGMANTATTLVRQYTSASDPTPINVPAGQGKVEFLWAPLGTIDIGLFQTVSNASPVTITPLAGRFSTATAVTIPGIPAGGIVMGVLRGWSGAFLSYDAAIQAGLGMAGYSNPFQVDTGDPTAVPAGTPGNIVNSMPGLGFAGMTLTPIPEPTTFALAGLGAAALLIVRRRK